MPENELIFLTGALFICGSLPREDRNMVLHGPDHETGNRYEDKENDDNDSNCDVLIHYVDDSVVYAVIISWV